MTKLRELWNEDGYLVEKDGDREERLSATFVGQEHLTKAEKAAQQSQAMDSACPTCSKLIGDHTPEEILNCAERNRRR